MTMSPPQKNNNEPKVRSTSGRDGSSSRKCIDASISSEKNNIISKKEPKKRMELDNFTKCKIIQRANAGETHSSLAKEYGLCKSAVGKMLKRTDSIKDAIAKGAGKKIHVKAASYPEIDAAVYNYLTARYQQKPDASVSREMLQQKALVFAEANGVPTDKFVASNGWFEGFKERYKLLPQDEGVSPRPAFVDRQPLIEFLIEALPVLTGVVAAGFECGDPAIIEHAPLLLDAIHAKIEASKMPVDYYGLPPNLEEDLPVVKNPTLL